MVKLSIKKDSVRDNSSSVLSLSFWKNVFQKHFIIISFTSLIPQTPKMAKNNDSLLEPDNLSDIPIGK